MVTSILRGRIADISLQLDALQKQQVVAERDDLGDAISFFIEIVAAQSGIRLAEADGHARRSELEVIGLIVLAVGGAQLDVVESQCAAYGERIEIVPGWILAVAEAADRGNANLDTAQFAEKVHANSDVILQVLVFVDIVDPAFVAACVGRGGQAGLDAEEPWREVGDFGGILAVDDLNLAQIFSIAVDSACAGGDGVGAERHFIFSTRRAAELHRSESTFDEHEGLVRIHLLNVGVGLQHDLSADLQVVRRADINLELKLGVGKEDVSAITLSVRELLVLGGGHAEPQLATGEDFDFTRPSNARTGTGTH